MDKNVTLPGFPSFIPVIAMQHLQSLFCFRGFDLPARFGIINLGAWLGFMLTHALSGAIFALHLIFVLLLAVVVTATTRRRLRDADLSVKWLPAPLAAFLLCATAITYLPYASSYFLLILPLLATLVLMSEKGKHTQAYIAGYHGPVDLSQAVAIADVGSRIEPTLLDGQEQEGPTEAVAEPAVQPMVVEDESRVRSGDPAPWLNQARDWLTANKQAGFAGLGLLVLSSVTLAAIPLFDFGSSEPEQTAEAAVPQPTAPQIVRLHPLDMPDDYRLLLDEHNGLVIHWSSSDQDNPELWSILTASGEDSCAEIVFNDKTRIRTNLVSIEQGDYFAAFSPLDTARLVQAVADKSRFNLCGYEFSLKGTRAIITEARHYSNFLDHS